MLYHDIIMKRDEEMDSQIEIRKAIDVLDNKPMTRGYVAKYDSLQNQLAYSCRLMVALDIIMCNMIQR